MKATLCIEKTFKHVVLPVELSDAIFAAYVTTVLTESAATLHVASNLMNIVWVVKSKMTKDIFVYAYDESGFVGEIKFNAEQI